MLFLIKVDYIKTQESQISINDDVVYSNMSDWIIVQADDRILALEQIKEQYDTILISVSSPILIQFPTLGICNIEILQNEINNLVSSSLQDENIEEETGE